MQLHRMSDALIIAAVLLVFIALWGTIVFLIGWKESSGSRSSKLRRYWIVVFAACGVALLIAVFVRTTIPRNPAVEAAARLALQNRQVQTVLGDPIRYTGVAYGGYRGIGEASHVSAGLTLKGSKQSGTLNLCGVKHNGRWQLLDANLVTGNHVEIPLAKTHNSRCGD
jgi:hypothetical protein